MLPLPEHARAPRHRSADDDVADRAERLITGDVAFFGFPWARLRSIDAGSLAFPVGLEIRNNSLAVDLRPAELGLTWDNAQVLQLGGQRLAPGEVLAVTVDARKGNALEVWANDTDVTVNVVNPRELARREEQRREEQDRKDKGDSPIDVVGDLLKNAQVMTLVAVVVVGVILWQVAKNWNGAIPAPGVKL